MALRWIKSQDKLIFSNFQDHAFVYDPSEYIGRTLFETGVFQRKNVEMVLDQCFKNKTNDQVGLFLEVGANIGTQSIYASMSKKFTKFILVEPDPINLRALQANIILNKLDDCTVIVPYAISDTEGEAVLRRNSHHSGMSTIEPPLPEAIQPDHGGEFVIPTVTGDSLLSQTGVDPSEIALVWMDVEGHEPKALRGMKRIIEEKPPIFFEYSPSRMTDEEMDWIDNNIIERYSSAFKFLDKLERLNDVERRKIRSIPGKIDILVLDE
jgi:FkbM family methyltransferase